MSHRAPGLAAAALLAASACAGGAGDDGGLGGDADPTAPSDAAPGGSDAPSARDAAPPQPRTGVLLFSGHDGNQVLDDMWVWDGEAWLEIEPEGERPSPRIDPAMVYDEARARVVLFGGTRGDNVHLADTWEWDGERWHDRSPADGPPARFWHAMAYDPGRARVVLFGGTTDGIDHRGDTWEWDGQQWHDVSPRVGTSPARASHAMAYDPVGERVLLFGGDDAGFDRPEDTWAWNGEAWQELSPAGDSPPSRADHAMAYDPVRQRAVVFGGIGPFGVLLDDTWVWDGERWHDVSHVGSPPGRFWHAMASDRARERVVMFGGSSSGSSLVAADTWRWRGDFWGIGTVAADSPPARRYHALAETVL
jgi:hypothetical protein